MTDELKQRIYDKESIISILRADLDEAEKVRDRLVNQISSNIDQALKDIEDSTKLEEKEEEESKVEAPKVKDKK